MPSGISSTQTTPARTPMQAKITSSPASVNDLSEGKAPKRSTCQKITVDEGYGIGGGSWLDMELGPKNNTSNSGRRRSSCCEKFTNGLKLIIPTFIRSFIIVGTAGSLGNAAKAGLISSMIRTEDKPSQVLVVAAGSTFFAASAICMAPRLGKLLIPRDSTRCAELVRGALGYSPWLIMGAQVLTATQMPNLSPPAIALAGVVVQRIMSNVLRDMGAHFSTGIVPRHKLVSKEGNVLEKNNPIQLSINKQRTLMAMLFYFTIVAVYVLNQKNETLEKAFGTDGLEFYEGGKKNFEGILKAGMPSVVLKTLVESLDDVGFLIAAALTASHHKLEIQANSSDTKLFVKNFKNYKVTLNNALDSASMRTLFGSLVMSASNAMTWNKEKIPEDTINWLNITAQALTECRGYLLEIRQKARLSDIKKTPLRQEYIDLQISGNLDRQDIATLSDKVLVEAEKINKTKENRPATGIDATIGGGLPEYDSTIEESDFLNKNNDSKTKPENEIIKFHDSPIRGDKTSTETAAPEIPTTPESKHVSINLPLSSPKSSPEPTTQHKET